MNETAQTDKALPAIRAGGSVRAIIPQTFDDAYRVAKAVAVSGLAPDSFKTPEQLLIAIMHGAEVGLPPMQALQSIAVINGRPSLWGDGALGLVRGSGLLEYCDEEIQGQGDSRVAICTVKRRGETKPLIRRFSVADAKRAGLWEKRGKSGQSTPWVTYPERMLAMRARSWALRDGFADVLRGLAIAEEAMDTPMKDVTPPTPPSPPSPQIEDQTTDAEIATDEETSPEKEPALFDPDAFVENMEAQLASARDQATLDEIWLIAEDRFDDIGEQRAESVTRMYQEHTKRLQQ